MHGLVAASLVAAAGAAAEPASVDYALHCQGCHLEDGAGTPGAVPALAGTVGRLAGRPGGREYLVRVPGVAQSALADRDLAALLDWMLARFGAGALPRDFAPYTEDEVGRWRRRPFADVASARRALFEEGER